MSWHGLSPAWQAAFEEAWAAHQGGNVPIGASIADEGGQVLARGRNRLAEPRGVDGVISGHDLGHAEVNALLALPELDRDALRSLTLHTTVEPCPQCAGVLAMHSVRGLCYAAREPWSGAADLLELHPYLKQKGMRVSRGPAQLARASLLLVLLAEFKGERFEGRFRAAFETHTPHEVRAAERLHALGGVPSGLSAEQAYEFLAGVPA